jgi:hypothetical protein
MARLGFKRPALASPAFALLCGRVSKAALVDALWCACQLGTDESREQITAQAARNLEIALDARDDRVPRAITTAAQGRIDSDPPEDE